MSEQNFFMGVNLGENTSYAAPVDRTIYSTNRTILSKRIFKVRLNLSVHHPAAPAPGYLFERYSEM